MVPEQETVKLNIRYSEILTTSASGARAGKQGVDNNEETAELLFCLLY